jgi:hypothetical protein
MDSLLIIVNVPQYVPRATLSFHWQYRESHRVEYFDKILGFNENYYTP